MEQDDTPDDTWTLREPLLLCVCICTHVCIRTIQTMLMMTRGLVTHTHTHAYAPNHMYTGLSTFCHIHPEAYDQPKNVLFAACRRFDTRRALCAGLRTT